MIDKHSFIDENLSIERLYELLCGWINNDLVVMKDIRHCQRQYPEAFKGASELFQFTIKGLYQCLVNNSLPSECPPQKAVINSAPDSDAYRQFRQQLYRSNLNERLAVLGYKVIIEHSTGKVDSTWYQLVPLE